MLSRHNDNRFEEYLYATLTNDDAESSTYGTPKKIGNAVSVDINPTTNTANL